MLESAFLLFLLRLVVNVNASGSGFIIASSGTTAQTNVLLQFSTEGKILLSVSLSELYDNAAYDAAKRLVYFSGVAGDASFITAYYADTLHLALPSVPIHNDNALLDLQFDQTTNMLLALTSDSNDRFVVANINRTDGEITILATLPANVTSVSENTEAFDEVAGIYWIAVLYETGPSGWLPIYTRTGKVGPFVRVADWVQNTVWNGARQSLCGIWTDFSSLACTNVSTAQTQIFSPALNFSAQGFRQLGASAFNPVTQEYFAVFETHKPAVSWVRGDLTALTPFATNIGKYFVETMVFVPASPFSM